MIQHLFHAQNVHGEGNPHHIKVLMYHRIVEDERLCRAHWMCVHVHQFHRHLELLDRWGFTTITFDDYQLFLDGALNLPKKPVILTFDDGYVDTYQIAFPLLQEFGMRAVVFVLGERRITSNVWDRALSLPEASLMDGEQIIEMHGARFEIGAHSMTHAKLPRLPQDKAWEEISCAKTVLEVLLQAPVRSFSYPYELVDGMTKHMVKQAGYAMACSVSTGPATFGEDTYEIRRIAIHNTTGSLGFGLRLLTPFPYYEWIRWKARHALRNRRTRQQMNWRNVEEQRSRPFRPLGTPR